ncbi:calcium/sodium antiporter [Christensenellaceae bacterium NSJ-53]|uniref:Calcium/sodium antiporter n=1 Tax=Gehongia tenuis TaxID=2763655 RepID=A0A926D4W0_9FIRM|nr:calcium/sodium antiporter [Gehongia tenuis]
MDLEVATCIAFFLLGLAMLVKGGDIFVDGSLWIARKFGISELVIGATVVSIGTTLPELTVSATAAVTGHAGIAYGNAIGSVICNTALIAGLSLLIRPVAVSRRSIANNVIFFFAAAVLYTLSAVIFGGIPRMVGALLLTFFVFYCVWTLEHGGESRVQRVEGSMAKEVVLMILGAAAVYLGSRLVVENAEQFAIWMKVPEEVVALTMVALGTSLPELATAVIALKKKHGALSLGNILGANLFNLVLVSGLASLMVPTPVDLPSVMSDLVVMFFVMLVLTLPILVRGRGSRIQGLVLLAAYGLYAFALYH